MSAPESAKDIFSTDGIIARSVRAYGSEKLDWLERFLVPALTVTQENPDRIFVDLFAGPGRSVVRQTKEEFSSGTMRALRTCASGKSGAAITSAVAVNLVPKHHEALGERIQRLPAEERLVPIDRIHRINADANAVVAQIMRDLPRTAYALVFADPESASQLPWSTVNAIRKHGPMRTDFYMLFPYNMDITRNMPWGGKPSPEQEAIHDAFFGSPNWREVVAQFKSNNQRKERRRAVMAFYLDRLRTLWDHPLVVEDVVLVGDRRLYSMIFASRHPVATKIAAGVTTAKRKAIGQGEFQF